MDFCVLLKFDKSEFVVVLLMFVELILQEMDLLNRCEDVKQTSVFCVTPDSPNCPKQSHLELFFLFFYFLIILSK